MHTIKGAWAGQTFALATCNESSGSRKSRIRRSKEDRKAMAETFIKTYQKLNNGDFPSLNLTHKEVGGSFYTVREIVREIIQENRVLGPAKLSPGEQNNVMFADQYPLGSISTEPQSLSLSGETHVISTFAVNHKTGERELADFDEDTQLDVSEHKGLDDGLQISTSGITERDEESDKSRIFDFESDHQKEKNNVLYSSEINGSDHEMLNEQMVGGYETTEENEISDKYDLLNDISLNPQNTNAQVLDSIGIISEHVNESLGSGVDSSCPTVKKDEIHEVPISTKSVIRERLDVEGGTDELEHSKAGITLKTTELLVEKFPLRPVSKKIDDLDSRVHETISVVKSSKDMEHEHDRITSLEKAAELVNEPVDVMLADPTSEKSNKALDQKPEPKMGQASLEILNGSNERGAIAADVEVKASSTVLETVNASSRMHNATLDMASDNGSCKKTNADEVIEIESNASVEHGSSQKKGGNPPLDRINLNTWKGAAANSEERETNPLLALLKSFVTAFVKFWTEE